MTQNKSSIFLRHIGIISVLNDSKILKNTRMPYYSFKRFT